MTDKRKNSHCSWCGAGYSAVSWPRTCAVCGATAYRNPLPVAVALLPVRESGTGARGLVVVRRTIEPKRGMLALPGGFMDHGETWQEAVARELAEETGITSDPAEVSLADAHTDTGAGGAADAGTGDGYVILFGLLPERVLEDLPRSSPTDETDGWELLTEPADLAFPLHTLVARGWFAAAGAGGSVRR